MNRELILSVAKDALQTEADALLRIKNDLGGLCTGYSLLSFDESVRESSRGGVFGRGCIYESVYGRWSDKRCVLC